MADQLQPPIAQQPIPNPLEDQTPQEQLQQAPNIEQQPVPLPSTAEAQEQTMKAQEAQKKFEDKRRELESMKGPHGQFPSDEEVLNALEADAIAKEQQQQLAQEQQIAKENEIEAQIEKRRQLLSRAAASGVKLPRDEELDSIIEKRADQEISNASQELAVAAQEELLAQRVQQAETPTEQEVEIAAAPIRAQVAENEAQKAVAEDALSKAQQNEAQAREKVAAAEQDMKDIDPKRYWNKMSTGQKILAAISLAAASYGSAITGTPNHALNMIQKAIDNDIEAQKLDNENKYKKALNGLKVAELELDRIAQKTQNDIARAKIQQIKESMRVAQDDQRLKLMELYQSQQAKEALSSGRLKSTVGLGKEERERVIRLPDGSIALADNKEAASDVRKFVSETQPGIKALGRLERMIDNPNFSRLSLKDRAAANTERRTLVGALRLSLVGPGALTEKEMELIQDTIGNPNKFTFSSVEKKKLETLKKSLKQRINDRYRGAGVEPPTSKRERLIEFNMKRSGKSEQEVQKSIDNLIRSGKLSSDFAE